MLNQKIEDKRAELIELMGTNPAPEPTTFWNKNRLRLRQHFLEDNPYDFWQWGVLLETMQSGSNYLEQDLEVCKRNKKVKEIIVDQKDDFEFYEWPNLVRQASHLVNFIEFAQKDIEDLGTIAEIGGGFGAMLKVCRLLGFEGQYFIYDFPEFNWLQSIYTGEQINSLTLTDLESQCWGEKSLLISMWGLSEFPSGRPNPENLDFESCLFGYNPIWSMDGEDGFYDNISYFYKLVNSHKRLWFETEIPGLAPNRYLIGTI